MTPPSGSWPALVRDAGILLGIGIVSLGVVVWLGTMVDSPNYTGHAAGHLIFGIPMVLLGVGLSRLPPTRVRVRIIARRVLFGTLIFFSTAQMVEAIGAFGYGETDQNRLLIGLHNVAAGPTQVMGLVIPAAVLVFFVAYVVGALSLRLAEILCAAIICLFAAWLVLGLLGVI